MFGRFILWVIKVRVEFLDQGHVNVTINVLGQGLVPVSPDELPMELIILFYKQINIPLRKDVPGVNVLRISLPCDLGNKSGCVIWFPRSGGSSFPFSRGHLHKKESQESS